MGAVDGYGYGYGSGSGYGYGYGYGSGSGYGYGSGDGSGYGYGYGSGDGVLTQAFADHPAVKEHGLTIGLWRSDSHGRPANGGHGDPVFPGLVQETTGPLQLCRNGFHATCNPTAYRGDRWWLVGLYPPVESNGEKMAALKRLIIAELV